MAENTHPVHPERSIELHRLVKTYRSPSGPARAVRGIDLSIQRGETVSTGAMHDCAIVTVLQKGQP